MRSPNHAFKAPIMRGPFLGTVFVGPIKVGEPEERLGGDADVEESLFDFERKTDEFLICLLGRTF